MAFICSHVFLSDLDNNLALASPVILDSMNFNYKACFVGCTTCLADFTPSQNSLKSLGLPSKFLEIILTGCATDTYSVSSLSAILDRINLERLKN